MTCFLFSGKPAGNSRTGPADPGAVGPGTEGEPSGEARSQASVFREVAAHTPGLSQLTGEGGADDLPSVHCAPSEQVAQHQQSDKSHLRPSAKP